MLISVWIIATVVWTLCAASLGISYWNYSRYVEEKSDPVESKRNLQTALYVRRDASISEAEFEKIASSHYRPYLMRFRVALTLGLLCGVVGLAQLLAYL
jgi:uncharacterized membrane protein